MGVGFIGQALITGAAKAVQFEFSLGCHEWGTNILAGESVMKTKTMLAAIVA